MSSEYWYNKLSNLNGYRYSEFVYCYLHSTTHLNFPHLKFISYVNSGTSGQKTEFSPTMNTWLFIPSACLSNFWQLSTVCARGFSSRRCLPACRHSVASGSWRWWGTMMTTASNSPHCSASVRDVNTCNCVCVCVRLQIKDSLTESRVCIFMRF